MTAVNPTFDFATALANSVHDMKNSLGMVLGMLDEMATRIDPALASQLENLPAMQYEGQRVNNQLVQLLAIYRIGEQNYAAQISEVEVSDFLDDCAVRSELLLASRGIAIEVDCDPCLIGFFDPELVFGVINNVINNAYRYAQSKIRLSAEMTESQCLRISVDDDGRGYPEAMLCGAGTQQPALNFSAGSSGLGLYFSHLVASMHRSGPRQGLIECSNQGIEGGGRFSIVLP